MPDSARRARQEAVYRDGLDAPIVVGAVRTFDKLLADMESALEPSPWLAGLLYSLADAAATPYITRLNNLGLLDVWAESRPRVLDWFARVRERPSFKAAVIDYFTENDAAHLVGIAKDTPDKVRAILAA